MNNGLSQSKSSLAPKPLLLFAVAVFLLMAVGGVWAPIVLCGLVLILLALLEYPLFSVYLAIGMLLAVPVYVVIPPLGPLPNLPVSLIPLLLVLGINFLAFLLSKPEKGVAKVGKHFLYALAGFSLLTFISLSDESTTRETVMTWIRTIPIPLSVFWLALRNFKTEKHINVLMEMLTVIGILCSGFAIVEFALGKNFLIEKLIMSGDDSMHETMSRLYLTKDELSAFGSLIYRCFSVFITPIEFGTFMTLVLPYPTIATLFSSGKMRWYYALAAVVCFLGVLMSFSRGPLLTSILQMCGLGIFLKPIRRLIIIGAFSMAIGIVLAWPIIGEYVTSRVKSEDNVTLRFKLWEIGLRIYTENPFVGVGIGNYVKYQNRAERDYRVGPIYEGGGDIEHVGTVDNSYIQLAAEAGTLGFAAFFLVCYFFVQIVKKLYRHGRATANRTLYVNALTIGCAAFGYLFNAITFTAYSFFVVTPTLFLFFAAALVLERYYWPDSD